ncbi:unnamed protein product [Didymodactylos carnosus]|uniref:Uncharacterized protein n=2 Tax=Didymodactylos carnosus TaxID=1234261 RepID=A0A815BCD0_9BILA|nr:unnamed protein product [Didymodactylos carnosus]CAF4052822.1 unnamed protein product [Didymodactylos carnosus]
MSAMQKLFGGGGGGGGGGLNQNQTDNINNQGLSQQPPLGNQQTSPPPIPTQNSNNFSQGIGNSFQQRNRSNPSFGNMPGASQGPPSSGLAPIQNLFGRTGGQQHQPLHDPHMRYKVRGNITNTLAMMDDEDLVNSNRQMKNWNPPSERMSRLMARPHEQNYNNNTSRLELEYPIENVYVGPDISPSVAIKVNEAVDKDRLGNHYHVQRFIYEPVRQQLTLGTGEHIQRRLIDHPNHTGERHMFESPHYNSNVLNSLANDEYYPGTHHKLRNKSRGFNHHFDIDNDLPLESYFTNPSLLIPNTNPVGQFIENLLRTPGTTICKPYNSFDLYNQFTQPTMYPNQIAFNNNLPVNHYVADALPNDPMRNF